LNDALQLIYLQEKNRYFVGNITLSFSRHTPRIDPLYSFFGFKAAYKLNFEDRANRLLMYDLMDRFNERLARLRFGTTSWSEYLIKKKNIAIENLPNRKDVEFERHSSSNNIEWLYSISKESKQEAVRIGAPAWQVHHYPAIQERSKSIVSKNPEFYEYFDQTKVRRILGQKHNNRQNIRKVFQLYYSLVWLYK